ncbi:MAG: hypothetical protein WC942_05640, partial [Clostridia bacterium]
DSTLTVPAVAKKALSKLKPGELYDIKNYIDGLIAAPRTYSLEQELDEIEFTPEELSLKTAPKADKKHA